MKKYIPLLPILFFALCIFNSFRSTQGTVTGKITPADAVNAVWAVGDSDSARVDFSGGNFSMTGVPGLYKLYIDAKDPYKDASKDNVQIKEGASVDLGEISLVK